MDICTEIIGCGFTGSAFFINGESYDWSSASSSDQFNISYNSQSSRSNFCFTRISENVSLTEYCHVNVPESECGLICSSDSGKIELVSHSNIIVKKFTNTQSKLTCIEVSTGMALACTRSKCCHACR